VRAALALVAAAWACAQPAVRGFGPDEWAAQRERETRARAIPQAERIRTYLERMSAEPHHAGSPGSRAVAEYAAALMREWGLPAKIETFEALLPYPTSRVVELVSPTSYTAKLQEPAVAEDRDSGDAGQLPSFNAYSASGDVTAPLVYVNYGLPEDYEFLKRQGIDVRGKIVIARYGRSWRGIKPKLAAEAGAAGCLLYSDPREDGYYQGDVYPKGPFRPPHGVQRGSVMDLALYPGDPLSPGWASEKGAKRLPRDQAKTLLKIPVLPLSYADAAPLLRALGGPVAPEAWRGALALTYHVGPGPATVRLKVDFDWTSKPIHNVITTIPGSVFPDQWVILGNHHDAWVNGASDPLSGASALLETARTLQKMIQTGWRPKRTIVLALWDGEEFGLIGSTEWVEKHRAELEAKAAVYLNTDSNGRGPFFASGSPQLEAFLHGVLRDLPDPASGKPLADSPRVRGRNPAPFRLGALGSGSDFAAFFNHAGIASLNLGFAVEPGGVYHSAYDSWTWFQKFSDADLSSGQLLAQLTTTLLLRLADTSLLPFQFTDLAREVRTQIDALQKDFPQFDARDLQAHATRLLASSRALDEEWTNATRRASRASLAKLARLNSSIFRAERTCLAPEGLAGREWYRHVLLAPGLASGYSGKPLPGVRESLEAGRPDVAASEARKLARALQSCATQLDQILLLLRQLEP
jgi:N-acetylated-alpha-linked acidic dipeptidase